MYPPSILQEIKDRLSIVAVVGEYLPLKPAGRNHRGLCPFHTEKSPSFMVNDDKQIYHCFGCGEGGDVFRFVMKQDGMTFPEAIRSLADRAGVRLPEESSKVASPEDDLQQKKKKWALRANQVVAEYFHENLLNAEAGNQARNYLIERGISENENFKQHFLGYADDAWDGLTRFLTEKKVPLALAAELGLVRPRSTGEGYYDFFRHRIIFPITNPRGEIVGFGGRTFGQPKTAEGQDGQPAKYLNSPDSFLYHKSHSVFGLSLAQQVIRREDVLWVVEGYLDVIALHQLGIANTVAPLGTALTSGHLRLLMRYSRNMIVVFDGDAAGMNAARRSWPAFLELNLVPKVVILPDGEDPDSYVRKFGAEALRNLAAQAGTLGEWVIDCVIAECGTDTAGQIQALQQLRPLLKQVTDPLEQAAYLRRLTQRFNVEERQMRAALGNTRGTSVSVPPAQRRDLEECSLERRSLALVLQYPVLWPQLRKHIAADMFQDAFCQTIAQAMWQLPPDTAWSVGKVCENLVDKDLSGMIEEMSLSEPECADDQSAIVLEDYLGILQLRHQKVELQLLNQKIAEAQVSGDESRLMELLAQKQAVVQTLHPATKL